MNITNTGDATIKPSVVMLVYGEGGVGKSSFAATAPSPLLLDFENGSKYFGLRGIKIDVARINKWADMREVSLLNAIKSDIYDTIIIDPIGEAMEKLKMHMVEMRDSKFVQKDGSPTMAGWGWLKKTMREYIKWLRDLNKNVIIVAHLEEKQDEGRLVKRPKVETKLSDELVAMVDIVAYMTTQAVDGEAKRILLVDSESDKYTAKDRTGQLGNVIPPNFAEIITACQGTATYKWSKVVAPKAETKPVATKPVAKPAVAKKAVAPVAEAPAEPVAQTEVEIPFPEEPVIEEMPPKKPAANSEELNNKLKNAL
jgi:phage nucleotide-binding protein